MTTLPDAAARDRARTDLDHNLVVDAGAGTGKTTVLINRIIELIATGRCVLDQIAAITFTEKAAGELKLRLRNVLEEQLAAGDSGPAAADNFRRALEDLDRAHVSTIHAFCAAVLRERPAEAGVDPGFAVLDPLAAFILRNRVWERWLGSEMAVGNQVVSRALAAGVTVDQLQEAAEYLLEHRDLLALVPVPEPAATDGFVDHLGARLRDLRAAQADCTNPTDAGSRQIAALAEAVQRLAVLDSAGREQLLLTDLEIRPTAGNQMNWRPRERLRQVKGVFRELQQELGQVAKVLGHNLCCAIVDWLTGYLEAYEAAKWERGALDFADLLINVRNLLRDSRPVRRDLQRRFRVLLVDEFQDTDPLQTEIVFFLAEREPLATTWREVDLAPGKLFLVGDPKQSIYRFRRADIELYDEAKRALLARGAALDLRTNFRSRQPLIAWLNNRFAALIQRPEGAAYQPDYVALAAPPRLPAEDAPGVYGLPLAIPPADGGAKSDTVDRVTCLRIEARLVAEFVADFVRRQHPVRNGDDSRRAARYGDICVLFRDNDPMHVYADEFRDREIPYRISGGKRFYVRDEIASVLALLRAIANPQDQLNLVATLRGPFFGFSDEQLLLFKTSGGRFDYTAVVDEQVDGAGEFHDAFRVLQRLQARSLVVSPATLLAEWFDESHALPLFYLKPHGDQRVANVLKLVDLARALESEGVCTLRGLGRFLSDLEHLQAEEGESPMMEETDDAVRLMTIHKAKGLEFPVVVLADGKRDLTARSPIGVVDRAHNALALRVGRVQTRNWKTLQEWEKARSEAEEIRLLYVAATRARDCLVLPLYPEALRGTFLGRLTSDLDEHVRVMNTADYDLKPRPPRAFRIAAVADADVDARASTAGHEWAQARAVLTAAAACAPRFHSPSTIAHARQEREQQPRAFGQRDGARVGSLVHAILQRVDVAQPRAIESLAAGCAAGMGLDSDAVTEACALARRAFSLPVLMRAKAGGDFQRELPFTWRVGEDVVEGVIDLAFREHGQLVIVDYKTDDVTPGQELEARAAGYRAQAVIYAAALEEITGEPVDEVVLAFLRPGVETHLRTQWRSEARELLADASVPLAARSEF